MWLDKKSSTGPPPKKYLDRKFIYSVQHFNPDFQHKLWNRAMIDELIDNNQCLHKYRHFYYHELRKHIEKCDFARYMVLYVFGGVYLDLDMEALRSFNSLIHNRNFVCIKDWHDYGLYTKGYPHIFNGFMGCSPKHYYMEHLLDAIMYRYKAGRNVFETTGPVTLGTLAVKLDLLTPDNNEYGGFSDKNHPEFFVNPCLIMANSLCHSIDCSQFNPYVTGHWTEGTNWIFEWENLKEVCPQTVERFHKELLTFLLLIIIALAIWNFMLRRKRN